MRNATTVPGGLGRRRVAALSMLVAAALALAGGCVTGSSVDDAPSSRPAPRPSPKAGPLDVRTLAAGLANPWDLGFLPDGKILLTQREGILTLLSGAREGAARTTVAADLTDVHATGEGGLMGILIHPDFASSRLFTTCQTHWDGPTPVDVRLVTWRLADDDRSAMRVRDPLLGGLPLNPSGRHSGCRPTLAPDGSVFVATGDSADAAVPQDRTRLGGKVLRIDLAGGGPAPGNPFSSAADPAQRLVYSYGHRNVQGVAVESGTGRIFASEHGPSTDDEVNLIRAGGNYGWDPSRGGTGSRYDEGVPMTDTKRFPDAVTAIWSSGSPTLAISGSTFLPAGWGGDSGALAVTALKASKVLLLQIGPDAAVQGIRTPAELNGTHGRLRAARVGPDGALYVTTDNGSGDELLRIAPMG